MDLRPRGSAHGARRATATLSYAMSTTLVNGERGKGNFTPPASENQPVGS
jgi:hypothetical protein